MSAESDVLDAAMAWAALRDFGLEPHHETCKCGCCPSDDEMADAEASLADAVAEYLIDLGAAQ